MGNEKLTAAQRAVVENRGGPLLVSAAAGSGKTKVLVDRLLARLTDPKDPANIDEFLIITYTKAAASELRGKIATKLAEAIGEQPENRHLRAQLQRLYLAKISTVHAFCSELLREYAFSLDLSGELRVADEQEAAELRAAALTATLEQAYGNIHKDQAFQCFVDSQGFGRDDRAVPNLVEALYQAAQCHVDPEQWLNHCLAQSAVENREDAGETPWGKYLIGNLHACLEGQMVLFRDLLERLEEAPDLLEKYGPTLEENLKQMESLLACDTWESCRACLIHDFGRLKPVRTPSDPDLARAVKEVRKAVLGRIRDRQVPFAMDSREILRDLAAAHSSNEGLCGLVLAFARQYREEKESRKVLDFNDLEHLTLELLLGKKHTGPTWAAGEISARFREVMVDEYQDTNAVQDRIFRTLTRERGNLFMVGDVKQSIYRFRLADPGIFLEKYRTYKPHQEAADPEGRKILLSENFRSSEAVLAAANHVFAHTMCPQTGGLFYGEAEALRAGIPHETLPQPAVELHCLQLVEGAAKYEVEAAYVARRIRHLLQEPAMISGPEGLRPVGPGDIVILLRSPGTSGQYYRKALENLGIPVVTDAGGNILTTSEISILRSLLQVLDNPFQDIPLQAVLLSPIFDFTADGLGRLRGTYKSGYLYEGLSAAAGAGDSKAAEALELLESLRRQARLEPLTRLLDEIYRKTHLESVFGAMSQGETRRRNLRFFYESAAAFESGGRRDLPQFLDHLQRLESRGLRPEEGGAAGGAVSILSIHKSKGLEYPVVFLSNLSGQFNREDLKAHVLVDPELGIGCCILNQDNRSRYPTLARTAIRQKIKEESTSEELRVLYVAMTRARDMLIMTYADKSLLKTLQDLADNLTPRSAYTLAGDATCLGDWVLMGAMLRMEAAELFQQAGRPPEVLTDGYPWRITYETLMPPQEDSGGPQDVGQTLRPLPPPEELQRRLTFAYPHAASVGAPAKITATQLKGRELDREAAEGAGGSVPRTERQFRIPEFAAPRTLSGRDIGTATHLAMQFIRYGACGSDAGVARELERLVQEEFITPQQAEAVNRQWIRRFFDTELGRLLMDSPDVLREFKFSLLESGGILSPDLAEETLLLQGVVDCCLMEKDGMTVLDFKTDYIPPEGSGGVAGRYAPQVRAYGKALARIWEKPVKKLLLYFFRTGELVEVVQE